MNELVILKPMRSGASPDGDGCLLEVETQSGPYRLRFTFDDADRLIAALQAAKRGLQRQRAGAGEPPLPEKSKVPVRWETTIDPINQIALLRARFADDTTSEAAIPRREIAAIAEFLRKALIRFESGGEMRQ